MSRFNQNIIMGIESSCDETAIAIYQVGTGLLAHNLHSQIKIHQKYGGVMPEIASRDHIKRISSLINQTLTSAKLDLSNLNAIAYTKGPGLTGSLMVGASVARSLAYALNIKAIAIHHLEGHLLAPMLDKPAPKFPFVALLISGGHTLLIKVTKIGDYKIIGESVDDAVGEAFDKTARLLGLPYPGGPELAKLATSGEPDIYNFPRPMIKHPCLNFSFSGLKTYAMTTWQRSDKSAQTKANIALAFEQAVASTLLIKCQRAMLQTGMKTLVVSGGVSANLTIRSQLQQLAADNNWEVFFPRHEFCTDNGAMIAYAGTQHLASDTTDLTIQVQARWSLNDL